MKKVVVIGSGFAGMSAACFMAKAGWDVTVFEKNEMPGGRARQLKKAGFTFDMGPSWYWMPGVFEHFFNCFGKKVSDYYKLQRLDPSYRVYWSDDIMDIPADYEALKKMFDKIEPGSGNALDKFLEEAAYKYEVGINKLVYKPGQSIREFADTELVKGVFKLDVFTSIKKHIGKYFKHPKLQQLLEFPVLFLGALPSETPALYSLMNYADIKLGTWYPHGLSQQSDSGMYSIVQGMYSLAKELGVTFRFNHTVTSVQTVRGEAKAIEVQNGDEKIFFETDVVISNADYHFTESKLLDKNDRSYSEVYWNKRVMAPSCILYYIGLNKKLENIPHHSLFFDTSFEVHGKEIYAEPRWPSEPLFYVSVTSVSDNTVAPPGCENLFFLIPVATGLQGDTAELREKYFEQIAERFEKKTGQEIRSAIICKHSYSVSDFVNDYNSFKGNAYGLANTLMQTAVLKPSLKSKKVKNLYYTGQLTVPGPGVPPALISGEVVAKEVLKNFQVRSEMF